MNTIEIVEEWSQFQDEGSITFRKCHGSFSRMMRVNLHRPTDAFQVLKPFLFTSLPHPGGDIL